LDWRRATEIFKVEHMVMFTEDSWKQIVQGHCADSYLLSVLSIIGNDLELLKKLFVTTEVNEVGIYAFNFYVNGKL